MLFELFKHLTTTTPEYVKKMGYLREIIAIEHRYNRCKKQWQGHLDMSKQTILHSLSLCNQFNRVVILGSGFLLDLPLRELSNAFEEVVLVDIVHMQSVIDAVSVFSNIKIVSADITGIAERLFHLRPRPEANLPVSEPNFPHCDDAVSLVVSLNILSQLPIIPTHFLMKDLKWQETEKLLCWSNNLMYSHYNKLKQLPCPVCLITDWEMIYIDKRGDEIDRQITVPFLAKIKPDFKWQWSLAPLGIESREYAVELSVVAILMGGKKISF